LIIVVGLAFEARIAAGPGVNVICSGDGRNLATMLAGAIAETRTSDEYCRGVVSFGVSGGLAPHLPPGTCVVGSAIISGTDRTATDREWSQELRLAIPGAVYGPLIGVPAPIGDPKAKQELHARTGAIAVDMESHIVAQVAADHGISMAAVRVITDPAVRALPQVALAAMRANGTADIAAMVRLVMRQPRELPALARTALDAWTARASLRRGRKSLAPVLIRSAPRSLSLT
jgi:hopanoid-associated phosphorylase